MSNRGHWDIFCKVIDNYGDAGVCWRLCADLASRGQSVRLWIDDTSALTWMAPDGHPGVQVVIWDSSNSGLSNQQKIVENFDFYVLIESFGCDIDPFYVADYSIYLRTICEKNLSWINLEYISAESYAERNHLLASPVLAGPASGLSKTFFYPGFTSGTGGLLREPDCLIRQSRFKTLRHPPWLPPGTAPDDSRTKLVSLFCYEPAALGALLSRWAQGDTPIQVFVTTGRATQAVQTWVTALAPQAGIAASHENPAMVIVGALRLVYLPPITQIQFDELLGCCDINFVRGEDSLVRAIWAGKPFIWHIYPQDDGAHHAKLEAFLACFEASPSWAAFHRAWNAQQSNSDNPEIAPLPSLDHEDWAHVVGRARERLVAQKDLTTQLMDFVTGRAPASLRSF